MDLTGEGSCCSRSACLGYNLNLSMRGVKYLKEREARGITEQKK